MRHSIIILDLGFALVMMVAILKLCQQCEAALICFGAWCMHWNELDVAMRDLDICGQRLYVA